MSRVVTQSYANHASQGTDDLRPENGNLAFLKGFRAPDTPRAATIDSTRHNTYGLGVTVRLRSAGVVPMRACEDGWRVLALRVYRNWDFPKGLVDEGESRLETAIREAAEEASLDDLAFRWGTGSVDTEVYGRGKVATYFVAETKREDITLPTNPELGHPEHHEGRWLTFEEAAARLPARLRPVLSWARETVSRPSGP